MLKSYLDLRELRNSDIERFNDCVVNCKDKLNSLWHYTGYDWDRLDREFPKSGKEMIKGFWEVQREKSSLKWALIFFSEIIQDYWNRERWKETDPILWPYLDLSKDEARRVAFLNEKGFLDKFDNEEVTLTMLVDFMVSNQVDDLVDRHFEGNEREKNGFLDIAETKEKAYRIFIKQGADDSLLFLRNQGIIKNTREGFIRSFERKYNDYRGFSKNYGSSKFERQVSEWLMNNGYFFIRHFPYREIGNIDKRYVMDFYFPLNKVVVETTSREDDFMHGLKYQMALREKEKIAAEAEHRFIVLTDKDNLQEIFWSLQKEQMPEEGYVFESVREKLENRLFTQSNLPDHKFSRRNAHFWQINSAKGRYLKAC